MCMQDLMIQRSITWKTPVNVVFDAGNGWMFVTPNPSRVAIAITSNGGDAVTMFSGTPNQSVPINVFQDETNAFRYAKGLVTSHDVPGLPSLTIGFIGDPATHSVLEAVIDTPLSRVVESMYNELVGR